MGRVTGPITINIIEIPPGAFISVLGNGLTLDAGNRVIPNLGKGLHVKNDKISVKHDKTLKFEEGALAVNSEGIAGEGLGASEDGTLHVKLGAGLELDGDKIAVYGHSDLAGDGLKVDDVDGKLDVKLGPGLTINADNEIVVSEQADFEKMLSFMTQTDTELFVNGNVLTMKKTFTRYDLLRNSGGMVVGIGSNYKKSIFQDVTLPTTIYDGYGCYGYGSGLSALSVDQRESTPETPNFYSK